ncbi:MAG: CDP-glycerol glycerophosphotransferase family protein [Clostridium sp.]|nr:CDP-glycerol glycerophosphotransferase family protein [Clostridium sp.]MCM1398470.1 CDP-glycerol glycerophosphotransferase family protein [Clostridium sp.]MCM1460192.1 CDP-glycerol glycerophosphotransferase family protein [Bacteroides sp.]
MSKKYEFDVSVIIPVYNVEEYLKECLDSMLVQGNVSLQIIMIDDGSTDGSGKLAQQYVKEHTNFEYHLIENGGLGHARNYAIQFVKGKYLTFFDSDDIIVDGTYAKMFQLAEKYKSDLTICDVARFNSQKTWAAGLFEKVFEDIEDNTHITKSPRLLYDTIVCDKLIRTSFYKKNKFFFTENALYEDIPVSMPMHYKANSVSILNSVGYLWRVRDGASKSITQGTSSQKNLTDRLDAMKRLNSFYKNELKNEDMWHRQQEKNFIIDLLIFVNECNKIPHEQAEESMRIIREYIDENMDKEIIDGLPVLYREKYKYVMNNDLDRLVSFLDNQSQYHEFPVREDQNRLLMKTPEDLYEQGTYDVTNELNDAPVKCTIRDLKIDDSKIIISGHVFKPRINIPENSERVLKAYLYNQVTHNRVELPIEDLVTTELTAKWGQKLCSYNGEISNYNYDGAGFQITLDAAQIAYTDALYGRNNILIEYTDRFCKKSFLLKKLRGGIKNSKNNTTVFVDNNVTTIRFGYLDEIFFDILKLDIICESLYLKNDKLICKTTGSCKEMAALCDDAREYKLDQEEENIYSADISKLKAGGRLFTASEAGDKQELYTAEKGIEIQEYDTNVLVVNTISTRQVRFVIDDVITKITNTKKINKILQMTVSIAGNKKLLAKAKSLCVFVRDDKAKKDVVLAEAACDFSNGANSLRIDINFAGRKITKNFYNSTRTVCVEYKMEDNTTYKTALFSETKGKHNIKIKDLKIGCYRGANGLFYIKLTNEWSEEENSPEKRRLLTNENYPKYRKKKICENRIIFESMWGTKYSCNPQALYEYIDKHYPEYECIWSLEDPRTPIKGKGIRVRRGSQKYFEYLATAKYFVNNVNFEDAYVKRKGQIEIQTMHGTPLKTIGLDVTEDFSTEAVREKYIKKNSRWDYLIVQGKFMEEKGYDCYRFNKKILTTGYPRTDRLFHTDNAKLSVLKQELGLPLDKKLILYAPTWRVKNRFDMMLDLEKMKETLKDEYALLVRLHHFSTGGYTVPADDEFIFDLGDYQYVEDLYNISDILITDYSSVMFDYALLNKPMIFFTYDMEEYCDKLRGLYIDFEKEAPGTLAFTSDEVINAIVNVEEEQKKNRDRIESFHSKFLTYENEKSCEKVVQEVMKPRSFKNRLKRFLRRKKK